MIRLSIFFFFFQAEDGIRDKLVTGVQTCALPICLPLQLESRPAHGLERDVRVVPYPGGVLCITVGGRPIRRIASSLARDHAGCEKRDDRRDGRGSQTHARSTHFPAAAAGTPKLYNMPSNVPR